MPAKNRKPPPEPKYHHGDLPRAILDGAVQLIEESGVAQLSLRAVARKIGVTTAAPYHHFKDRQALLIEIAIRGYRQLFACLESAQGAAQGARREIEAESRAYLRFAREHAALYSVMFSRELENHHSVELRTIADSCFALVCASVARSAKLAPQDTAEAALCVWSMLHGLIDLDQNRMLEEARSEQERIALAGVLSIVKGFARAPYPNQVRRE